MPRAHWNKLPLDRSTHPEYIERILRNADIADLTEMFMKTPEPLRDIEFRREDYPQSAGLKRVAQKIAAGVQTRGQVQEDPCEKCRDQIGPFVSCVRRPDIQSGKCGNCIYEENRCSIATGEQSKDGRQLQTYRKHHSKNNRTRAQVPRSVSNDPTSPLNDEQTSSVESNPNISIAPFDQGYTVLGRLVLPPPPQEFREKAEQYRAGLKKLDERTMTDFVAPIADPNRVFEEFKSREPEVWRAEAEAKIAQAKKNGVPPTEIPDSWKTEAKMTGDHLVRPSGSLGSSLIHRLHQPSLTTFYENNGETADPSNGCISMVTNSGLWDENTLLFDHVHRRHAKSKGQAIAASSRAKVEIVYGRKVQVRLLGTQSFDFLPLWGEFEGLMLYLAHETGYPNPNPNHKYRRVILMANHPQNIFYQNSASSIAITQELIMQAAALMIGNTTYEKGYYTEKRWRQKIPSVSQQREIKVFGEILKTDHLMQLASIEDTTFDDVQKIDMGAWSVYFNNKPHSNDALRMLIPTAQEELNQCDSSVDWRTPSDLPLGPFDWFQGQYHVLFKTAVNSFDDVIDILQEVLGTSVPSDEEQPIRWVFRQILIRQKQALGSADVNSKSHQHLWHSTFDRRPIQLNCYRCKYSFDESKSDNTPRWSVHRPGHYIAPFRAVAIAILRSVQSLVIPTFLIS